MTVELSEQEHVSQADKLEKKLCDLVMVGGITSGIAYPGAILELKDTYQFRNIGGTSIGAMAAAAAAAAEFNRDNDKTFTALQALSDELSTPGFLLSRFKAPTHIQPLLNTLLAFARATNQAGTFGRGVTDSLIPPLSTSSLQFVSNLFSVLRPNNPDAFAGGEQTGTRWGILVGALIAFLFSLIILAMIVLFVPITLAQTRGLFLALLLLLIIIGIALGAQYGAGIGGSLGALLELIKTAVVRIPGTPHKESEVSNSGNKDREEFGNYFGLCTGHDAERKDSVQDPSTVPLTDWFQVRLNTIAGKGPEEVLTFGELKKRKDIALQMVTTNLSHGQPYTMPRDLRGFIFNEEDMHRFFPAEVVRHMISYATPSVEHHATSDPVRTISITLDKLNQQANSKGKFHFLPEEDALPVIVATRMSLSFPLLLSAVPLYTISNSAVERLNNQLGSYIGEDEQDLQINWFSDGGISSNFPIHFFDAWLPNYPTFGINFTSMPQDAIKDGKVEAKNTTAIPKMEGVIGKQHDEDIFLPRAEDVLSPEWRDIKQYMEFFRTIVSTGMNYRDSTQSRLPSYRDRIVQIRFTSNEGGLNLNMPADVIKNIVQKGHHAGRCLREEFDFNAHRWVRFQVLLALLEKNFEVMRETLDCQEDMQEILATRERPYSRSVSWHEEASRRVAELSAMIKGWQDADKGLAQTEIPLFYRGTPEPVPVLRVTPEL